MKKYIWAILAVLLICQSAFGSTYASKLDRVSNADMKTAVLRANLTTADFGGSGLISSGRIYYVDSATGDSASNGESWITAMATLDQAINRAAARVANGTDLGKPVIYVRESHAETLSTADAVDVDLAGLTIIGLGSGAGKPIFSYDTTNAGEFVIGAANVTLANLRFTILSSAVTLAIDIEAGGDNAVIRDCEFGFAGTSGDEWTDIINVTTGADNVTIEDCFFNAGPNQGVSAIYFGTIADKILIRNNIIYGDYSTAGIENVGASDGVLILYNIVYNGNMDGDGGINAVAAMTLAEGTSGLAAHNTFVSAAATAVTARVGDDMTFVNNFLQHTDGDEFSGGLESDSLSVALTASVGGL